MALVKVGNSLIDSECVQAISCIGFNFHSLAMSGGVEVRVEASGEQIGRLIAVMSGADLSNLQKEAK